VEEKTYHFDLEFLDRACLIIVFARGDWAVAAECAKGDMPTRGLRREEEEMNSSSRITHPPPKHNSQPFHFV